VAIQQATWQAWWVAFYLEACRWRNSLRRSLQNPIGLAVSILVLAFVMGLAWAFLPRYYWMQPDDPLQRIWLEASPEERLQMALPHLLIVSASHLSGVVVLLGFRPYQFLREFSESDLNFLFATPVPSWRLMRVLLVLRATLSLGILIPVYFMVALLLAGRMFPVLVLDYLEQLRAGAWLLIGYWVLRYLQGLFFDFFRFYWALRLRERPWLRWVMLAAVGVWWLLMVGAVVAGWLIAESRGISGTARGEYALNWFPAWLLTLPARAVADAVLAIFEGWTLAMGVMIALWAAGCLWLATRLTRDSRRIVDLVAVGVQLGAGKQTDETDEVPYAVRIQLEQATRGNSGGFRTPALLERWSPTGIGALLWRDLVFTCRQTPVWISALTLIAFPIIFSGLLFGVKQQFAKAGIDARLIVFIVNFLGLFFLSSALGHASSRQPNAYYDITRALPFSAEQHIRYLVLAWWLESVLLVILPSGAVGLVMFFEVWYLWLGSLVLMASYTLNAVLLNLIGSLLTAQPYLEVVEGAFSTLWSVGMLALFAVGMGVYWLALSAGVWFPLFALLLALASLPLQYALYQRAVALWRDYTPFA
jgi:hypothetical protein